MLSLVSNFLALSILSKDWDRIEMTICAFRRISHLVSSGVSNAQKFPWFDFVDWLIDDCRLGALEVDRTGLYADEVERIGKPATYRRLGH